MRARRAWVRVCPGRFLRSPPSPGACSAHRDPDPQRSRASLRAHLGSVSGAPGSAARGSPPPPGGETKLVGGPCRLGSGREGEEARVEPSPQIRPGAEALER